MSGSHIALFASVGLSLLILVGCEQSPPQQDEMPAPAGEHEAHDDQDHDEEIILEENFDPINNAIVQHVAEHFTEENNMIFGDGDDADFLAKRLENGKIHLRLSDKFVSHFPDGMLLDLGLGVPEAEFSQEGYVAFLNKLHDYHHSVEDLDHDMSVHKHDHDHDHEH